MIYNWFSFHKKTKKTSRKSKNEILSKIKKIYNPLNI
jgi:phage-related protein